MRGAGKGDAASGEKLVSGTVAGTNSLSSQPLPVGTWPWGLASILKTHSPTWAPAKLTFEDPQPRASRGQMADRGLGGQDLGVGGLAP